MFLNQNDELIEQQKHQERWRREIEILKHYGLQVGINYILFDFDVKYQEKTYYIHTFCGGESNKPIMILLHGYGGSNLHYSKMYSELIKHFKVFSIDLPGMGLSSKADINMNSFDEALNFFLGTISKYITEISQNRKVILVGHSFGGFIAAHLYTNYPHLISHLFLLSPAGSTYYTNEQIEQYQDPSRFGFFRRFMVNHVKSLWQQTIAIPYYLKERFIGRIFLKMYLWGRMKLRGDEYTLWKNYVDGMLELPEGSEKSICLLFHFPVLAKEQSAIELVLQNANIPVMFYFGESDWMSTQGAQNLMIRGKAGIREIENAGHQLNFENPQSVVNGILKKLKMEQYMKEKIQETFNLFTQDKKGYVDKKEIPYIMRFLGKFPSEAQVSKSILPQIEEDEPSESIKYQKFEPFMIQVLKSNEYDPDDTDTLLAAFRQLDEEKKGYIEIDTLKHKLTNLGIPFRPLEMEDFIKFATNGDPSATVIYYEDYVLRLQFFNQKHMESVMKQYNPEK